MFCPRCGFQQPDGSAYCTRCGLPLQNYNHTQAPQQGQSDTPPPAQPENGWGAPQGGGYLPPNYPPQYPGEFWGAPPAQPPMWPGAMPPKQVPQIGPGGHIYQDGVPLGQKELQRVWAPPRPEEEKSQADVDADPNFSRFVDKPDDPLPFYPLKIVLGILAILGAVFLLIQCGKLGTFRLLMLHAKDNIRGLPLLVIAVAWLLCGISSFLSKYRKGAAGFSGCMLLLAAGIGFTFHGDYANLTVFSIASILCAIIYLISAAGGVNIDLND